MLVQEYMDSVIKCTEMVITGRKIKQIIKEKLSTRVGQTILIFSRFNLKHLIKSILVYNAISMWERFFIFAFSPHM